MFSLSALHEVLHLSYNPVLKSCHQIYIHPDVLLLLLRSKSLFLTSGYIRSSLGMVLLYFFFFCSINSVACAIVAASVISASLPSGLPYKIFEAISPENNTAFCGTYPSFSRSSCCDTFRISFPSIVILPSVTS